MHKIIMFIKRSIFLLTLPVILLSFNACSSAIHTLAPDFSQKNTHSIAILPVLNETVDLDAPAVLQKRVCNEMRYKGYDLKNQGEIKTLLAQKNINEAGQVFSLTYKELGELLAADSLLFCTVTDWSSLYFVIYSDVTVEAKFELIHAESGTRLWTAKNKSSKISFGLDEQSLQENIMNAAFSPYEPRAQAAVKEALSSLPNGPYYQVLPRANEKGGCINPFSFSSQ